MLDHHRELLASPHPSVCPADGQGQSATMAVGRTRVNIFRAKEKARASQPHFPERALPSGVKGKSG